MTASSETVEAQLRLSPVKRFVASRRWFLLIPLAIITVMVATAVLADFLTPYSATDISLSDRLRPPFWEPGGSLAHPLGTDPMGRDLLARMIYGARISLLVGCLGLCIGGGVGALLG